MVTMMLVAAAGLVLFIVLVALMARAQSRGVPPPDAAIELPADVAALDDAAFRQRLREEVAAGRKITAIKWVRARNGLELKEALDLVESLAPGAPEPRVRQVRGLDDVDLQTRVFVELAAGRKVEAIRLYREGTGLGLKEAKDAVEALERGG